MTRMEMDILSRTRNITKEIQVLRRKHTRNRTIVRHESLSSEQQLTETILNIGILPAFCILGLVTCWMFLRAVWRKRGNGNTNSLPVIISIVNALYLLLTLEENIEKSLTIRFGLEGGFNKEIKSIMQRIAKFSLHMGTAILCVHSIEVCHAIIRPLTYRKIWDNKTRLIVGVSVISFGVIWFVAWYIAKTTMDDSKRQIFLSIQNSLEYGVFSIIVIGIMTCCYIIIIVKIIKQKSFKSSVKTANKNESTNRIIKSLVVASSVYFLLGVPVDVIQLIYSQSVDRKGETFWAIKVTQNILEVLYGSFMLCVFIINEALSEKRKCLCPCPRRTSTDEDGAGNNGEANGGIEENVGQTEGTLEVISSAI